MPGLDSEALDFRAASESFAGVRKLARRDPRTLRMLTDHRGRAVPTTLAWLEDAGREIVHGPDIAPDVPGQIG